MLNKLLSGDQKWLIIVTNTAAMTKYLHLYWFDFAASFIKIPLLIIVINYKLVFYKCKTGFASYDFMTLNTMEQL